MVEFAGRCVDAIRCASYDSDLTCQLILIILIEGINEHTYVVDDWIHSGRIAHGACSRRA